MKWANIVCAGTAKFFILFPKKWTFMDGGKRHLYFAPLISTHFGDIVYYSYNMFSPRINPAERL